MKFYEVVDHIPWPDGKRIYDPHNIKAVKINEFRAPKAGEWYISGAIPQAYIAHSDYDPKDKYAIVKLVRTKTIQTTMYEGDL
jgi:hypothetical protein